MTVKKKRGRKKGWRAEESWPERIIGRVSLEQKIKFDAVPGTSQGEKLRTILDDLEVPQTEAANVEPL